MNEPFGSIYADCYDAVYQEKNYEAECDLIERLFKTYGDGQIKRVLDLGCGTGSHAIPLARRGFEVIGVDRSEAMLARAREKAAERIPRLRAAFYPDDIRKFDLGRRFDAVMIMFAVLGYQIDDSDVATTLRTAGRHLRPEGLLLFDVWYGPAVLYQRPSKRVKTIPTPEGKIVRALSSDLDTRRQTCAVRYRVQKFTADRLLSETEEEHVVRYFFPLELDLFLESAGFKPLRLGAFPEFERDPDKNSWNVLAVARAA